MILKCNNMSQISGLLVKRFALLFVFVTFTVHGNTAEECLQKLPLLGPTDPMTIKIFYQSGTIKIIGPSVCKVIHECGIDLISVEFLMGAEAKIIDGVISCGECSCIPDLELACENYLIGDDIWNTCDPLPQYDPAEFENCMLNDESDSIVRENATDADNLGVQNYLPALVFNDTLDPCTIFNCEFDELACITDIKKYVCAIYQGALPCCSV